MPPKVKSVEGIIIIIDVGPNVRLSSETTFYSQAKMCLINILQRKIFAEKCKDLVGVVVFGADETQNKLAKGNQYQNIVVLQEPAIVDWNLIRLVENLPRGNNQGDWLDALVVAMDLLHDPKEVIYSNKKLVLMTDFNTEFSDDQVESIIDGLKKLEIELSVIGPSLEEEDEDSDMPDCSTSSAANSKRNFGRNWNGKVKSNQQLAAETVIKRIVSEVDGLICSFDEAIPQLIFYEKKSSGSANWNAFMDIGPSLKIPVTGKIKIKHATPAPWKKEYAEDESAAIIVETSYHKSDENQTAVDDNDIIYGYKYGTTLVPFGDEDKQLKYRCGVDGASLSVLGFTRAENVPLNLRSGDQVMIITARPEDEDAAVVLSAIIQGLKELNCVAVARKVYRKNLNPVLGALIPDITTDYECLIWVGLPFQEDVRNFTFPSFDKTLEQITNEQKDAMDDLITGMQLNSNDGDEEELNPTMVVNPQLQHFFNCLTQRALFPDEPPPAPQQHILDLLSPPEKQKQARDLLATKLSKLFPTKKVEAKTKKKKELFKNTTDDATATTSNAGADVAITANDLTGRFVTKISTVTPAQDFRALLMAPQPNYGAICRQMEDVILQLTEILSGDNAADRISVTKIIESLKVFREEATMIDPTPYNFLMQQLKKTVVAKSLNHLWLIVQQDSLGLISTANSLKSTISNEEASNFLLMEPETAPVAPAPANDEENYEEMLDDW